MTGLVWYAETGRRRRLQLLADGAAVAWAWAWWQVATTGHDLVAAFGAPGRALTSAGDRLAGGFTDVADAVAGTPLVGGALRAPFTELADTATSVAGVGTAQAAAAGSLADWVLALVLVVAVVPVVLTWAVLRVRGARRTAAGRQLRDAGMHDLLALRALTTQPLPRLQAANDDPVAAWRAGDTRALAGLELHALGLHADT